MSKHERIPPFLSVYNADKYEKRGHQGKHNKTQRLGITPMWAHKTRTKADDKKETATSCSKDGCSALYPPSITCPVAGATIVPGSKIDAHPLPPDAKVHPSQAGLPVLLLLLLITFGSRVQVQTVPSDLAGLHCCRDSEIATREHIAHLGLALPLRRPLLVVTAADAVLPPPE